ncbi:MAG TPA: formylglycine-generating enzyme family protein [Nocardioidaceae bacterium]|nr:formylglycine-generating enzyme family protein [Nocardioidaceae bacterium]
MEAHPCCAPAAGTVGAVAGGVPAPTPPPGRSTRRPRGLVPIPAGTFHMGDAHGEGYPADGETPPHAVRLTAFGMGATAVTNAQFAAFVKDTGHVTSAEEFGVSAVFHLAFAGDRRDVVNRAEGTPWWLAVRGADWRHPEGPASDVTARANHPVVHVSWEDARAYAAWAGKRLPTEAEWEYAARGGLTGARFAWGDELTPRGRWMCNIWQGRFPTENTAEDGHLTTAPVKAFPPNGYGVYGTAGNVWEWCADWFAVDYYQRSPEADPCGPGLGTQRVMRGGSYLCHESYCHRYRVAARSSNTPESTAGNIGFRCAG